MSSATTDVACGLALPLPVLNYRKLTDRSASHPLTPSSMMKKDEATERSGAETDKTLSARETSKQNFTIIDQDDQVRLVKQFMDIHEIDDKRFPARSVAWPG